MCFGPASPRTDPMPAPPPNAYLKARAQNHCTNGLVAMTSASRAEGRQFDPGLVYLLHPERGHLFFSAKTRRSAKPPMDHSGAALRTIAFSCRYASTAGLQGAEPSWHQSYVPGGQRDHDDNSHEECKYFQCVCVSGWGKKDEDWTTRMGGRGGWGWSHRKLEGKVLLQQSLLFSQGGGCVPVGKRFALLQGRGGRYDTRAESWEHGALSCESGENKTHPLTQPPHPQPEAPTE